MRRPISSWILLGLLTLTTLPVQAHRLDTDDVEVRVVSEQRGVLRQYPVLTRQHLKRAYVVARRGERYRIRVINHSAQRVGLVIAVDGRNILNGRRSDLAADEAMYVLGPYERAEYEGWRTSPNRVARFYFTDAADSYADAWGDHSAMGVIAVAVFRERRADPPVLRPQKRRPATTRSFRAEAAGTGFGEETHSPSRRVRFEPRHQPDLRIFIKYEWRSTLCRRGIVECRRHHRPHWRHHNRFWPEDEFAPYPWELD